MTTLEIEYSIQFLNSNKIKGRINTKVSQKLQKLKKQILQFQGIKNPKNFQTFMSRAVAAIAEQRNSSQAISAKKDSSIPSDIKLLIFRQYDQSSSFTPNSVVSTQSRKMNNESMFQETSMIIEDLPEQNFIQNQPEVPPTVCGYVIQPNSWFFCFSSRRYLVLNFQEMILYPNKREKVPCKKVFLHQIKSVKSYKRKDFYCIRIFLFPHLLENGQEQTFSLKFSKMDLCKQWVGYFNQSLHFSQFLKEKKAFSKAQTFEKYIQYILLNKVGVSTNVVTLDEDFEFQDSLFDEDSYNQNQQLEPRIYSQILLLKHFQVTHKIDSGSFSVIYLATKGDKQIALKQMQKEKLLFKGQMKYAVTELNVLIKCRSCPYIIPIYYAFQTHDYLYLGLKYISYGNLGRLIQKRKKLAEKDAISILAQLVVAIEHLHERKILYRDLKPQNILLENTGHIYLTDFGLAKELEQDEHAHSFLGTPLYLAPQRFLGDGTGIDFKSDNYAVGIIFFEMLHGFHPFEAEDFSSVVYNIKNNDVEVEQSLSSQAKNFLLQTLEKNPKKRLEKMREHNVFKDIDWKKLLKRQLPGISLIQQTKKPLVQIQYQIDKDYTEETYPDRKIAEWSFSYEE